MGNSQVSDFASENRSKEIYEQALHDIYHQRELEAAAITTDYPFESDFADIHAILAAYFATREAVASKLKQNDPVGAKWSNDYRSHPNYHPRDRVSAVLIVKNEAPHIARCLKSIAPIADEIVIVDTGSTDGTMEIVSGFNVPNLIVGSFEWINDFSAARNYALSLATGDWRLWIDADEEFDLAGISMFYEGIMRPHFGGYTIQIKNFTEDEGDESQFYHQNVRLFRNLPEIQFENRIHEMVTPSLERHGYHKANLDKVTLIHHGYRPSEVARKNKYVTYREMLEREVTEDPENGYQWFNLCNIYYTFELFAEQEFAGKKALQYLPQDMDVLALVYELVAGAQTKLERPLDALDTIHLAREAGIDNLLIDFEETAAYFTLQNYEKALIASDQCVSKEWPAGLIGDYSVYSYKKWTQRAQVLNCLARFSEAETVARKALENCPAYPFSHYHLAVALEGQGQFIEAIAHFDQSLSVKLLQPHIFTGKGRIYVALNQFDVAVEAFQTAYTLNQEDYRIWTMWADACEKLGEIEKITECYEHLLKACDRSAEALINYGRVLDRAGKSEQALDCFVEAISTSPNNANAYFNCGDLLYRLEQFHDAAHIYQLGLRADPSSVNGWFVLGNSLAMLGLNEGAITALNEALKIDPSHEGAQHNLQVLAA